MDFTRQPIIESVITPKEGCKLVIRSSKNAGQEEYFVEALEMVSFGNALFYRSIEKPKSFLVPASDYEVVEVREARMALKNVGIGKSLKIGGGREVSSKQQKPAPELASTQEEPIASAPTETKPDERLDKRRDKRRQQRRRRGREDGVEEQTSENLSESRTESETATGSEPKTHSPVAPGISSLLAPPPTLISETIARYKDNAMFKSAFYVKEDEQTEDNAQESTGTPHHATTTEHAAHPEDLVEALEMQKVSLEPSEYGYLDFVEEETEEKTEE